MRKSLIAQSVAAMVGGLGLMAAANAAVLGFVGAGADVVYDGQNIAAATVLQVNTDGIGHINIVPYYTVQNGNDTYINIVNTDTRNGKAVKVRFRSAGNSDDVFDITVLMSPGDVWAAAITKDAATGLPMLAHNDKTCTLPADVKQKFVTLRLDPALSDAAKATQASEGYVEILTMADIPPTIQQDDAAPIVAEVTNPLYTATKHVNGVAPCTATALNRLFTDSTSYPNAEFKGLAVPTTGLMTNWTIINVPKASSFSGAATAVEARVVAGGAPGFGNMVLSPQADTAVTVANARLWTSDPLLRGAVADNSGALGAPLLPTAATAAVGASAYDFPDLSTPYLIGSIGTLANGVATRTQASLLTAALAVTSVTNEYVTDASILAKTDWIFSMPTRRYNVARKYETPAANYYTNLTRSDADAAIGGNNNYFTPTNVTTTAGQICVTGLTVAGGATTVPNNRTAGTTGDREERFVGSSTEFVISPGVPAAPLTFCGEVSVLTFNAAAGSSVLGAAVAKKDLTIPYADGWLRIATPGLGGVGLPIVGSAVTELINSAATPGTAGAYGNAFPHRATRP